MAALWRNTQWLALLDQCVVSGSNFLLLLYLGRQLPAGDFGAFSLAVMSTLFLANLHRATVTRPLNLLGANESEAQRLLRLRTLLKAHWLLIPVAGIVLFALSLHFFSDISLWLAACAYIALFYLQDSTRRYWYTSGQIIRAMSGDSIAYGGQLLLILVVSTAYSLDAASALLLISLPFGVAFLRDWSALPRPEAGLKCSLPELVREHWQLSRWLLLTVFVVWTASQLYPFLLAGVGPVAVAAFMASRNLLNAINLLVQSLDNYLPSRLAALLGEKGPEALCRHLWLTMAQVGTLGLGFVVLIWLSADALLHVIYGGTYDGTGNLLRILAIGSFCALIGTVLGAYSLAMHDTRAPFLANLGATAVTATVGLWLVSAHGVVGAAMGATLSFAAAMLLQGSLVWWRLEALTRGRAAHA